MTENKISKEGIDYWRQLDFVNMERVENAQITIIGAGGIGSFVAIALAKLGVRNLVIWDKDEVTAHNVPNQLFRQSDIGKKKVEALADLVEEFSGVRPRTVDRFWDGEPLEGIVISAVDDMQVRKQIWGVCKLNPQVANLVDGRIGGLDMKVISIDPSDIDNVRSYEATLFSNSEAEQLPCTARAIIDVGFVVAALIVRAVRGYLKDGETSTRVASMNIPTIVEVNDGHSK